MNKPETIFAIRLLRTFCPEHLYEEIEGDLIQQFNRDIKSVGEPQAKRKLIWNSLKFFRPGIILRNKISIQLIQFMMLGNYFKISIRTLLKNKGFSLTNISGLAIGMVSFLLIMHYVRFERSYEGFNKNASSTYRITLDIYKGAERIMGDCGMYAPVGPLLKEQLSDVIDFARIRQHGNQEVKVGAKTFYEEQIYFADPSALNIFSFDLLTGNESTALSIPFQAIITESMAKKYFGRTDVIDELIEIRKHTYKIAGVMADSPSNTHLKVKFLLSHASLAKRQELDYHEDEFDGNSEYTYLLMSRPTDLTSFNEKLRKISISLKDKIGDDRLIAESMSDIHLYSNKSNEPEVNGSATSVYFLLVISVFILIIAWINYVNLSTARAADRAREIGIRKVMGSLRIQLISQFLTESFLISLFAGLLALGMLYMALPIMVDLTGQSLPINLFETKSFWQLFIGTLIVGSILSGFYPAFVLSSFKPVSVLKGRFSTSTNGQWLRKGLVVFQFASTVLLMICVVTVYTQITFLQKQDLGMNIEQTLVLRSPTLESDSIYQTKAISFKKELLSLPRVDKVTQSGVLPGLSLSDFSTTGNVYRPGQDKNDKGYIFYINPLDEDFINAFQMQLLAGRNFGDESSAENQVIINQETMHVLGFISPEEAVGSRLFVYGDEKSIIGVLHDFHQRSPKEKFIPMVFHYSNQADYFSLRVDQREIQNTIPLVKEVWSQIYPGSPFDYFFLDERYNQQYESDQQFGRLIGVFSVLAMLIACLGLFGLLSFTLVQRSKEIGIRKILGSTMMQIVGLLSQDFIKLVLIAGLIALPFGFFVMDQWLSSFAVRITMSVWIFIVPIVVIIGISVVAISFQTIKAACANPADIVRHE